MNSSTKPYLIRAIYEWCMDNDLTPHISVVVYPSLDMPAQYVNNDEIVFNIGLQAAHELMMNNHQISFMARFNGIPRKLEIPIYAIKGIFAREVNQGLTFPVEHQENDAHNTSLGDQQEAELIESMTSREKNLKKPTLRIIK
ncbi:ClpXP protease specificity-enhancing factor [Nitrosomonas sp. JL21]|uniref:ClpXP protease specificity-enhancing factor n=1 Tax=Nitrosomonas sp. JL21 TaxID=153949 RepID=UPI00136D745E|nr:ClpXP protease specificity-enhancing factor [Nitrosomonas sp. JL21]MBL8498746.1 ClpXP protease specificity-enhancing factor [Nitrosomonas sp.]MCC7090580.1 ClpXP protease specificity-enhancing factor [Nitrosomonas sp.]MXS77419.1 ClpXP protease specificity-enhancing factor [Nitrosomonas sp. JL21]